MRFSELDGKRIGVWGAGREIRSLATQLRDRLPGSRIAVVADDGEVPSDVRAELQAFDPVYVDAREATPRLRDCDVLVRSPGVSIYRPELAALRESGVPVTTATSHWLAEREGRNVVGITGTKGKSTTAALVAHLARAAGRTTHLAGNIGTPVLDLLGTPDDDLVVLELSSYQTADLAVGPEVAVVTNLYPEHLSWHGTHDAYYADKLRLIGLPEVERVVLNATDDRLARLAPRLPALWYGAPPGWHAQNGRLAHGETLVLGRDDLPLRGRHNALNVCAALTALEAANVELPALPDAFEGFAPLPHRLQAVLDRDGVLWVDDSISTTPESALAALESFPDRAVVLIAGGEDRGQEHGALARALVEREASVVGLPETGSALVAAARGAGLGREDAREVADMESAVTAARALAEPGTVVLLSPAAPSYNAYRNFEERGTHFASLAKR
jgi:UDP-N-acetylmuramoyl-L-alanine---L-glutamate ligase